MSTKIKLTRGFTIVDDDEASYVKLYDWYWHDTHGVRRTRDKMPLSRFVLRDKLKENPKLLVDHISGDRRDNQKSNLRTSTKAQNTRNQKGHEDRNSKFKGVSWNANRKKWQARICFNRKQIFIGYFDTELEAARAYNRAALKYFGEFAKLNVLEG